MFLKLLKMIKRMMVKLVIMVQHKILKPLHKDLDQMILKKMTPRSQISLNKYQQWIGVLLSFNLNNLCYPRWIHLLVSISIIISFV